MYHNSFYFLFFYVTVALVYAKSGHMYHKNLITFSSYMASFFSGDFTFCMLMQLLFLLYIWFIFPGWWLRKLAALSADTRHDTNISAANTRQYFVLLLLFAALHILSGGIYLFTQIGFRYLSCSSVLFIFLFQWIADFFVLYGNLLHSANIKQLRSYPVRFTWSMSFMLHADFSLQNKQQFFPSSSELSGSHSLYGAPPVCDCMLLWLASAYISRPSFVSGIFANK